MFSERIWGLSQWSRKRCRTMNMRMVFTLVVAGEVRQDLQDLQD